MSQLKSRRAAPGPAAGHRPRGSGTITCKQPRGLRLRGNSASRKAWPTSPAGSKPGSFLRFSLGKKPAQRHLLARPTNHLDMEMRQALALALAEFEGPPFSCPTIAICLEKRPMSSLFVADGAVAPWDRRSSGLCTTLLDRGQGPGPAKAPAAARQLTPARPDRRKSARRPRSGQPLAPLRKKILGDGILFHDCGGGPAGLPRSAAG